jgi:hypothetical protein
MIIAETSKIDKKKRKYKNTTQLKTINMDLKLSSIDD